MACNMSVFLEEQMRHVIKARGFRRVHLEEGGLDFILRKIGRKGHIDIIQGINDGIRITTITDEDLREVVYHRVLDPLVVHVADVLPIN